MARIVVSAITIALGAIITMSVHISIETATLEDRVIVPIDAVRSSGDGPWVELVAGTGTERRKVQLGPRDATRVVVESGLDAGDRVRLTQVPS